MAAFNEHSRERSGVTSMIPKQSRAGAVHDVHQFPTGDDQATTEPDRRQIASAHRLVGQSLPLVVETDPKTRNSRRSIVPDGTTVEVLRAHVVRMRAEASDVGRTGLSPYVFVDEIGEPLHPVRITRLLHAFQKRIGLPEITLHDLRHTSATVALLAGVHPKVVSERHGHASVRITMDRYSHVLDSMQVSAADAIGRFLEGPPDTD